MCFKAVNNELHVSFVSINLAKIMKRRSGQQGRISKRKHAYKSGDNYTVDTETKTTNDCSMHKTFTKEGYMLQVTQRTCFVLPENVITRQEFKSEICEASSTISVSVVISWDPVNS